MKEFLDKRVYIITFIFGLGGGILSNLLDIWELSGIKLTSIAVIFAFVISLFISLLLKRKWTVRTRTWVIAISGCLLLSSFVLAYNFFDQYDKLTFSYTGGYTIDSSGQSLNLPSVTHLKGCWYTEIAKKAKREEAATNNNYEIGDSALLKNYFGGIAGTEYVWDFASRQCAKRTMLISYSVFVLFLSATISLLSEVLYTKYKHKN